MATENIDVVGSGGGLGMGGLGTFGLLAYLVLTRLAKKQQK